MAEELFEQHALLLRPDDHVAVARKLIRAGTTLICGNGRVTLPRDVPPGHKFALHPVNEGEAVRKYGQVIGFATLPIAPGDHVHCHNIAAKDFQREHGFCADTKPVAYYPLEKMRHFQGYARADGRAGTRNYLAVISSVNCSAAVSQYVAERFKTPEFRRDFPHIDGVISFRHKTGCGMDSGEPTKLLQRVLAGIARHPNISGYVMIGLGCEVNQVQYIVKDYKLDAATPGAQAPAFLTIQSSGGVMKTVEAGTQAVKKLLPVAEAMRRTSLPISKLVLAENCGGSDGYSGITANPALGVAADELVRYHGTAVLAETPEIYGAEHLLTPPRRESRAVADKLIDLHSLVGELRRKIHELDDRQQSFLGQ